MPKGVQEGNSVQNSHAYALLLATIDTLDAVCAGHAKDLEETAKESTALLEKALRYRKIAKAAENERDEMREAVNTLVQLVERKNLTAFRPASMQISSLVEPLLPMPQTSTSQAHEDSYASNVISSLRNRLEIERAAHQRTKLDAAAHISALEARLARREAVLEEVIAWKGGLKEHWLLNRIDLLNNEDALNLLHAKNKAVEVEVRELAKRLERTKLDVETPQLPVEKSSSRQQFSTESEIEGRTVDKYTTTGTVLQNLDLQIRELGRQIDGFSRQRQELVDYINDEMLGAEPNAGVNNPVSLHQASLLRENVLEEAEQMVDRNHQQQNIPNWELLEPQEGDSSMMLSTPLLPTAILERSEEPSLPLPLAESTPISPPLLQLSP